MNGEEYEYESKLHALIAQGPEPSREAWQDNILTFLTSSCTVTESYKKAPSSQFVPSPLPINVIPKTTLGKELKVVENGNSALVLALKMKAPSSVIAALCQLNPKAVSTRDESGALPLHIATLRPSGGSTTTKGSPGSEALKTLGVLADIYPPGLVSRDNRGKTPLHWLLDYYPESRNVTFVELLSRSVEERVWRSDTVQSQLYFRKSGQTKRVDVPIPSILKRRSPEMRTTANVFTPASALIVPDGIFGCIPLHYAVMNGASKDVVKNMVKEYPSSVSKSDCQGRTPLHWHFGAGGDSSVSGDVIDPETGKVKEKIPIHHTYRSSHIVTILMHKDPSFTFDVARMQDLDSTGELHRVPIHYAIELTVKSILDPPPEDKMAITRKNTDPSSNVAKEEEPASQSCLNFKILKFLYDQCPTSLIFQDANGQTPLHVLFRSVSEWNHQQYEKALHIIQTGSSSRGTPKEPKIFVPPMELINLLMTRVDPQSDEFEGRVENHYEMDEDEDATSGVLVPDERGLLPLHCAVLAVTSPKILNLIIEANPTGLIQPSYNDEENNRDEDAYDYTKPKSTFSKDIQSPMPCFLGGRTPLHMAFSSPFVSRLHSDSTLGPLLFFNFSSKQGDEDAPTTGARVLIDGTIVLKMRDAGGNTPLHLAAMNNSSLTILRILLKCYPDAVTEKNEDGDLPLHLLMDRYNVFISAQLALAHSTISIKKPTGKMGELFVNDHSRELRGRVRELAKRQTVALRMMKFRLGGALFAPNTGWTSDAAEKERRRGRHETLLKVNLLSKVLIHDESCLKSAGSGHGMTPLHIVVAFRALPYKSIHIMLQNAPETARVQTLPDGYTPLDLHCVRDKIAGEISQEEKASWTSVRQMLFSYEVFPLENLVSLDQKAMQHCRLDEEFLTACRDQIVAEVKPSTEEGACVPVHVDNKHPVDPDHEKFGFTKDENIIVYAVPSAGKNITFSDVASRLWIFLCMFSNMNDKTDNYAKYVEGVLRDLAFDSLQFLVNKSIPTYTYSDSLASFSSDKVLRDYANPYCRAVMHSFYYFAGLYDFSAPASGASILLRHQGSSILLQVMEHSFFAGSSKDNSIETDEVREQSEKDKEDSDDDNDINFKVHDDSEFQISHRMVCIKLMKDEARYRKELALHGAFSEKAIATAPILAHYDATNTKRVVDKQYASDIEDHRFRNVCLRTTSLDSCDKVDISEYPYAIVYPAATDFDISDSLIRGSFDLSLGSQLCHQMGNVLNELHDLNVIHGSFGMRQVGRFLDKVEDGTNGISKWGILDLGLCMPFDENQPSYLGMIQSDGTCTFESNAFPPEMFLKLDTHGIAVYENYWNAVMELDNVNVPFSIIKPRVDPMTGDMYVMKCYYENNSDLPPLPYTLVRTSKSVDVWSFGVMLYSILTGGETLFRSNVTTGQMLSYYQVANWDKDTAERLIKQCIDDVAAQDLLLHILVPFEERQDLDMGTILSHPYFSMSDGMPQEVIEYLEDMRDEREAESRLRKQKADDDREAQDMKASTTIVARLSVKSQLRMVNSTSALINKAFGSRDLSNKVPYSYLFLPYKLIPGNNGRLIPTCKQDFQLGEELGKHILDLVKTLGFVSHFNDKYSTESRRQKFLDGTEESKPEKITADTLGALNLNPDQYSIIMSRFMSFVIDPEMDFVSDSTDLFKRLIQENTSAIASVYTQAGKAYLYLVDEFMTIPVIGGKYPHVFKKGHVLDIMYKTFPFMYVTMMNGCSVTNNINGLVRLFFEGAYPHTPPSWLVASKGLDFSLKTSQLLKECNILREIMSESIEGEETATENGEEDLLFFENMLLHIDSEKSFGGLRPVSDTMNMIWTSDTGVRVLKEESKKELDPEKLENMLIATEAPKKAYDEDAKIAELERKLIEMRTQE